jgi:hypothetical protein
MLKKLGIGWFLAYGDITTFSTIFEVYCGDQESTEV